MLELLIMNLLDTLSDPEAPPGPSRSGKRRFDLPLAVAASLLVLAVAFAPWVVPTLLYR